MIGRHHSAWTVLATLILGLVLAGSLTSCRFSAPGVVLTLTRTPTQTRPVATKLPEATTPAPMILSPTITAIAATPTPPTPTQIPLRPPLDRGWVILNPGSTSEPEIRSYVCPWLEFAGDRPTYTYRVVRTYPHDPEAYTQGLIYRDGILYESTGLKGRSSLRIVDLESGDVLQKVELPETYFAEGIALLDEKIYQLTWQEQTGFIYQAESLTEIGRFSYKTEGWGLTEDGEMLIMSDGSERLAFIDPDSMGVIRSVSVSSGYGAVKRLNELEYIAGEVWANVYQTSCIARIDPQNGKVSGWIDLSGMLSKEVMRTAQVPNGIAYDRDNGRIFVTGKFWPYLFEIEVLPAGR